MTPVATSKILVPRTEFFEGKEFYDSTIEGALRACQTEGFEPVFMPQLVDARIAAGKGDVIWQYWYSTQSLMVTGTTKGNNAVVVFAHVPNYFCNPDNIVAAKEQGLVDYAGILPEEEFQRLLDLQDDNTVFVVGYDALKNSESGVIALKDALKHPQTIPFLGGKERAEKYLERHKEVYGGSIGLWHSDDLHEQPLARLLFVGYDHYGGLVGVGYLNDLARFVGVRAEGAAPQKGSLDESILNALDDARNLRYARDLQ